MRLQASVLITFALFWTACATAPTRQANQGSQGLFNLVGVQDGAAFFDNPKWSGQIDDACLNPIVCDKQPLQPRCNDQLLPGSGIDTAERTFLNALLHGRFLHQTCELAAKHGHVPGHINVGLARYDGTFAWDGTSFDGDYDIRLYPRMGGLTTTNPEFVHVEFYSDETLNQLDFPRDWWWSKFRQATLEPPPYDGMHNLLGNANVVIGGLVGFDCEHDCHAELHPVYILAIREPVNGSERWAILIRNWGTEGWCSLSNHRLNVRHFDILLPYPDVDENTTINVSQSSKFLIYHARGVGFWDRVALFFNRNTGHTAAYEPRIMPHKGVIVSFDLPDSRERPIILGELVFTSNIASSPIPTLSCKSGGPIRETEDAESDFQRLMQLAGPRAGEIRLTNESPILRGNDVPLISPPRHLFVLSRTGENPTPPSVTVVRDRRTEGETDAANARVQQLCSVSAAIPAASQSDAFKRLCVDRR